MTDKQKDVQEWQPIETAPRDGTNIIGAAFGRYGFLKILWWQPEFNAFISGCNEMTLYNGHTFEDGKTTQLHSPDIYTPTHWMPLPNPPVLTSKTEE